jgi:hypothetical protein
MRYRALVAIAMLTAVAPAPALAQQSQPAVGLVLDVRGATEPAIKPYREVRAGDTVRLYSGAKLVVLQYEARGNECRTLTVEGGAVTFTAKGDPIVKNGIASAQDAKCPRRMTARSTTGAVVLRDPPAKLAQTPTFVIAGARAAEVGWLRVLDDNRKVSEVAVGSQQFKWPLGTPALSGNQHYIIEFLARDNTAVLASVRVYTSATAEDEVPTYIFVD